jgi:hypothetical protein
MSTLVRRPATIAGVKYYILLHLQQNLQQNSLSDCDQSRVSRANTV